MKNPFSLYFPDNEEKQKKFDQATKEGLEIIDEFHKGLLDVFHTMCDKTDAWQETYVKLGASDTQSREVFYSRAQGVLRKVAQECSL